MKTVFRKKNEGLELSSELDFARTKDIIDEFHYLVDTTESLEILLKHTYLIKVTPVFKNSMVCTNEEFDGIIPHMKDQKLAIVEQAKANQTPIIKFLKEQNFNPKQICNRINS